MVRVDVEYVGELQCVCLHGPSGQSLRTEAPQDNRGQGRFFSPTDMVGTAMASCILTIMGIAAEDNGWDIAGTKVVVQKEMHTGATRRIKRIAMAFAFPRDYEPDVKRRLEAIVKTCPVTRSLHPDVAVEVTFTYAQG